jgi:hypothetical protein
MAVLRISVDDDLKARAETRAAEGGYGSVEAYLEALMRADLGEPGVDDPDLERLLLRRLDRAPGVEFTPQFAEQFRRGMRG